jgi:hypothetical protein
MKNEKKADAVVAVEQDKTYEELVTPDLTGEAAPRGQQPNLGEFGPVLDEPAQTNGVDNENEYRSENNH